MRRIYEDCEDCEEPFPGAEGSGLRPSHLQELFFYVAKIDTVVYSLPKFINTALARCAPLK